MRWLCVHALRLSRDSGRCAARSLACSAPADRRWQVLRGDWHGAAARSTALATVRAQAAEALRLQFPLMHRVPIEAALDAALAEVPPSPAPARAMALNPSPGCRARSVGRPSAGRERGGPAAAASLHRTNGPRLFARDGTGGRRGHSRIHGGSGGRSFLGRSH